MLWNASEITGCAIAAKDGRLGTVSDFLFDDANWQVHWLVVDTGSWLSSRKVLLPPSAVGNLNLRDLSFPAKLTLQQVRDSPVVDSGKPLSRQMEAKIYDHYGWQPYWGAGSYVDGFGYVAQAAVPAPYLGPRQAAEDAAEALRREEERRLRVTGAVTGYLIHARDGEVGHVEDFLMEDADWRIHYLVVDTKNWLPGKKVLISPGAAREIDWTDKRVSLHVDRQRVKDSPAYDATTTVDWTYEKRLHNHYNASPTGD